MAIAFARISYHSRSQGHSAVAGAAYRAGVELKDDRTGEVHNFKNRADVIYAEILLPEGAASHFKDREIVWNAVEAAETRKNSQIAKDIVLALPRDLDLVHQIDLARNFTHYHFVRHALVADIAIHHHSDGNPHAHIYVSTRRLLGDRFDKIKARDLEPDVVRGRVVEPQYWGEQWRAFQNNYFIEHDIDLRVDANHVISQRHEGRIRDQRSHYLKEGNQLRRQASIEITLNDPTSLLNLLGSKQAVFSDRDMALLIHKNTETHEAYETALLALKSHADLILLGTGDDGRDRYTTRSNYQCEVELAEQAQSLNSRQQHCINKDLVQQASRDFDLNTEQSDALAFMAKSGDICAVVGRAGTGKSYMMRAAKQIWEASGYCVRGMAVSGIAAKGLELSSSIPSSTIFSFKRQLALGKLEIGPNDILIMDEAGMTDLYDLARVIDVVHTSGAKLVLVGDPAQLQPIGPGAPFRAIIEQIGFTELNQIQRQDLAGDCVASCLLSRGSVDQAIDYYAAQQRIHLLETNEEEDEEGEGGTTGSLAQSRLIRDWSKGLTAENRSTRLILAHRNIDVSELNKLARQRMQAQGLLGKESYTVDTSQGKITLALGDRILLLRNDRRLKISNGEFATIVTLAEDKITIKLGKQTATFSTNEYRDFTYGYAATVHKSQGTTFDHTFVYIAGRAWDRFLSYVAMTRHRKTLNVYADQSQFKDLDALKSNLSRATLKDSVLDWPLSFAIRRGFDPERLLGWFIDKVLGVKQAIHDAWLFVANYAAFKSKKQYRELLQSRTQQRKLATKIALFVDVRNELSKQARLMRQNLTAHEKLYDHPDYPAWYEQSLVRNRLAFEIKQEHALFEQALTLNRVSDKVIEKYALQHERFLHVKDYLMQSRAASLTPPYQLAVKINNDLSQHYSAIKYFAGKEGGSTSMLVDRIKLDAKNINQAHDISDEWERLKAIKSPSVERVIIAKSRLGRASTSLNVAIQTRGYEYAIKALYSQEKLFAELKAITPRLAQAFEKINQTAKEIMIDWKSDQFDPEFAQLKDSNDTKLQYLVKFRSLLKNTTDKNQEKRLIERLNSLTMSLDKIKARQELKEKAPNLAAKCETFVKFKSRQKEKEMERD